MTSDIESLYSLVYFNLVMQSPMLSGNMANTIDITSVGEKSAEIVIGAKYYDVNRFFVREILYSQTKAETGKPTMQTMSTNTAVSFQRTKVGIG